MRIVFNLKEGEQVLLRGDWSNYELCRISRTENKETGEVTENITPWKYFQSLPQAMSRILDLKVRASDATSLQELAADLETARAEIMDAWSTALKVVKK